MNIHQYFQYSISFIKTLTIRKVANSTLLRISFLVSKILKRHIHWGKVESLSIEPTNQCNLHCPECPSGNNSMLRSRLFLSENQFKTIIHDVHKHLVYLQLYFQGEPFMHPKIFDFINYATRKNIYTSTSTNGHFFNVENSKRLVDSGLQQLIISIDGTSQQVYEQYRVGGSLQKVIDGIKNIQQAKQEKKVEHPHLVIQFVVFRNNENQIPAIKRLANELGVADLRLKSAQINDFINGSPLLPTNDKFSRYFKLKNGSYALKRKPNFKCFRVWQGGVISAQGQVLPCCFDKDAQYSLGAVTENGVNRIFKSDASNAFRKKVWQHHPELSMCANCTEGLKKTWFNADE